MYVKLSADFDFILQKFFSFSNGNSARLYLNQVYTKPLTVTVDSRGFQSWILLESIPSTKTYFPTEIESFWHFSDLSGPSGVLYLVSDFSRQPKSSSGQNSENWEKVEPWCHTTNFCWNSRGGVFALAVWIETFI